MHVRVALRVCLSSVMQPIAASVFLQQLSNVFCCKKTVLSSLVFCSIFSSRKMRRTLFQLEQSVQTTSFPKIKWRLPKSLRTHDHPFQTVQSFSNWLRSSDINCLLQQVSTCHVDVIVMAVGQTWTLAAFVASMIGVACLLLSCNNIENPNSS